MLLKFSVSEVPGRWFIGFPIGLSGRTRKSATRNLISGKLMSFLRPNYVIIDPGKKNCSCSLDCFHIDSNEMVLEDFNGLSRLSPWLNP